MRPPAPSLVLVVVLALAPVASAADLFVNGQAHADVALGAPLTVTVQGTPGGNAILLLDVSPGPTFLFGQWLELGFTPALLSLPLGALPAGGQLDLAFTVPEDAALAGVQLHLLAVVQNGPTPPSWEFSPGASLDFFERNTPLAGNTLASYPLFEYVRAFHEGAPINVAVDPGLFPAVVGQTADLYVVDAKDAAGWLADPTLSDVSSGGAEAFTFVAGSIADNVVTVDTGSLSADAGVGLGVPYDVVVDLDRDGLLGDGDLIDGFGAEAGLYAVHDTTQRGPLAVVEALYSGGSMLGQNLFYPADIAQMGELPLVVVSHGNGHNYQWYDHVGRHLASYGFIVMSHQNNTQPGPHTAALTTLDNTDWFLGNLDLIEGGLLQGHVDGQRITWLGHSRGGEGVVRAWNKLLNEVYVPVHFTADDIALISSIAPTDFKVQFQPTPDPRYVPYHLWVGGADADVTGCANDDLVQSFHLHDRASEKRMSISLHGVGHGDFHNSTGSVATGPCKVGKADTHTIMRGYLLPLVLHQIEGNLAAEDFLWRQWERFRPLGAPDANPCVVVDLQYRLGSPGKLVLDDFQSNPDTAVSSSGGAVTYSVIDPFEGRLDDETSNFTDDSLHFNGFTQSRTHDRSAGLVFEWDGAFDRTIEFQVPPALADVSRSTWLSFRAAQVTRDAFTIAALEDLTFRVALEDGAGASSSVNIGAWGGGVEEPYQRGGCGIGAGWGNEFETIRIRLTDFQHDGTGLDLTDLARVIFTFGPGAGSAVGRLGLDDLEFVPDRSPLQ